MISIFIGLLILTTIIFLIWLFVKTLDEEDKEEC